MAYYVPLGPRGILLRIGTRLIAVLNGLVYWHGCRRRRKTAAPSTVPVLLPELDHEGP